jgi:hypothetical protein
MDDCFLSSRTLTLVRDLSINNEFGVMFITPFFLFRKIRFLSIVRNRVTSSPLGNDKSEKIMFIFYIHFIFSNINIFMNLFFEKL